MALTSIEILNGTLSIIFVLISVYIGLTIVSKYFVYKKRTFLLLGATWIGLVTIWIASSVSFLYTVFTGKLIAPQIFMFLGNAFLPLSALLWIHAMTDLVLEDKKENLIVSFIIYGATFETYFLYFLITDYAALGSVASAVDINYTLVPTIYHFSLLVMFLTTGSVFGNASLKAESKEVRLKGKFLVIAILLFVTGAILEIFSGLSIIILVSGRIILILSSFAFYGGFILPEWVKKLFISNKKRGNLK